MMILKAQGQLREAIQLCQRSWKFAQDNGIANFAVTGMLFAIWGDLAAERNELEEAMEHLEKGIELAHRGTDLAILGWAQMCKTRVLVSKGAFKEAEVIIQETQKFNFPPIISHQMTAWQIRIWLAHEELDSALEWAQKQDLISVEKSNYVDGLLYMTFARILTAQQRFDEADDLLRQLQSLEASFAFSWMKGHPSLDCFIRPFLQESNQIM